MNDETKTEAKQPEQAQAAEPAQDGGKATKAPTTPAQAKKAKEYAILPGQSVLLRGGRTAIEGEAITEAEAGGPESLARLRKLKVIK